MQAAFIRSYTFTGFVQVFRCNVNIVIPDDSAAFNVGGFEKRRILEFFIDGLFEQWFCIEEPVCIVGKRDGESEIIVSRDRGDDPFW